MTIITYHSPLKVSNIQEEEEDNTGPDLGSRHIQVSK